MPKFYRITVEKAFTLSRDMTVAVPDGIEEDNIEEWLDRILPGYNEADVIDTGNYDSVEDYSDLSVSVIEEEDGELGDEDLDLTDEEV